MNRDVAESLKQQQQQQQQQSQRVGSGGDHVGARPTQQLQGVAMAVEGVASQPTRTVAQLQAVAQQHHQQQHQQQQQLHQPVQQIVLQNVAIQPNTSTAQLLAGMMVVPPLSPVRAGLQTATVVTPTTPPGALAGHTGAPLIIQQGGRELQVVRTHQQGLGQASSGSLVLTPSSVSATGGTIHHLGQSPARGGVPVGIPPLANTVHPSILTSSNTMSSPQQQQQQHHVRAADAQELLSQLAQQSQLSGSISQSTVQQQLQRLNSSNPGPSSSGSSSVTPTPRVPLTERSAFSVLTPPNIDMAALTQSPERGRKRIKLEEKPAASQDAAHYRKLICDQRLREMAKMKENYKEHLTELFFLQHGRNTMDYHAWKRRPPVQLLHFLKTAHLDSDEEDEGQEKSINNEVKVITASGGNTPLSTPVAISTTLPPAVTALQHSQQGSATTTTATTSSNILGNISDLKRPLSISINSSSSSLPRPKTYMSPSQQGGGALRQNSISAVYESTIGSQEAIVERAKQEAQVIQRVDELRREGMWSSRRLPKVQEPARNKAHWDYLLEEMQWLAADFAQERKWKKAGARKIARMITRYHQELQQKELKAEKEEAQKTKRIASNMAKMVREFWSNIEKVVQYKQQSRLEEKRKKALDLHLSFIVDQTEKYSSWLTEGLATTSSTAGSIPNSPGRNGMDDQDFEPKSESDDEETIEREEKEAGLDEKGTKEEIAALQKESEIPIEDLL